MFAHLRLIHIYINLFSVAFVGPLFTQGYVYCSVFTYLQIVAYKRTRNSDLWVKPRKQRARVRTLSIVALTWTLLLDSIYCAENALPPESGAPPAIVLGLDAAPLVGHMV